MRVTSNLIKTVSFGLMLAAMPAWALAEGTTDNTYHSVNDITEALSQNPLDVIANHGGIQRSIDLNIQFQFNSSSLLPAAERQLSALSEALHSERLQGYRIEIVGHTDAVGSKAYNQQLSAKRADAVKASLVKDYGVREDMLKSLGKGESELIEGYAPDDARHRRVEIIAIALTAEDAAKAEHQPVESEPETAGQGENVPIDW